MHLAYGALGSRCGKGVLNGIAQLAGRLSKAQVAACGVAALLRADDLRLPSVLELNSRSEAP